VIIVKQRSKITITGYLAVYDQDKSGNALQISIESDDFITYIIETDQTARQMFPLTQKRLTLKGEIIGENEKSNPIIKVSEYRIISE